jgi:hypothetical protein
VFLHSKTLCSCTQKHCVPALKKLCSCAQKLDVPAPKNCVPALKNMTFLRSKSVPAPKIVFLRSKTLCSCTQKHYVPALKNNMFLRSKALCSCAQKHRVPTLKCAQNTVPMLNCAQNMMFLRSNLQGVPRRFFNISLLTTHVSFGYYSIKISRKGIVIKNEKKE